MSQIPSPHLVEAIPEITPSSAVMVTHRLRSEGKGLYTSEGEHFNNTIFARDSAIAARELFSRDPQIAHEVILTLASLQGVTHNKRSEEEPGRIHHESRNFASWESPKFAKEGFKLLSLVWGGNRQDMVTYFSLDSTALYALLVTDYAATDSSILNERVTRRDGKEITIEKSLRDSADWMSQHVTRDGLVEVPKHNKFALIHQTWKDSLTGYIREDGQPLNLSKPIAYLEVQALTTEALQRVSTVLPHSGKTEMYGKKAAKVKQAILDRFWIPEREFFASAIDYDDRGEHRRIDVLQSDPGWLLQTSLFDNLSQSDREKYISGIVRGLFSPDFLTDAGIRTRSLQYAGLINAADYHGSLVTWPVDTFMSAKGLRRQGFPQLAEQLEARILNAVNMAGNFYEFFFVDTSGKALLDPNKAKYKHPGDRDWAVQMFPESNIAWTVAAIVAIKSQTTKGGSAQKQSSSTKHVKWQRDLETEVLGKIKRISMIKRIDQLRLGKPEQPNIHIHQSAAELAKQLLKAYKSMIGRATSWRFRP